MRRRPADKKPRDLNGARRKNGPTGSELAAEDVSFLLDHLQSEEKNERVWLEMTTLPSEEDAWNEVEEHLLHKAQGRNQRLRRWKFFAK